MNNARFTVSTRQCPSYSAGEAEIPVGVVRRDPMAIKPFCGYHFGDYWQHWLNVGSKLAHAPKIFQVNWFRRDGDGSFIWPGFGENIRVLEWIMKRCAGAGGVRRTPVGRLPESDDISTAGLVSKPDLETLLSVDAREWLRELEEIEKHLENFQPRVPAALFDRLRRLREGCPDAGR